MTTPQLAQHALSAEKQEQIVWLLTCDSDNFEVALQRFGLRHDQLQELMHDLGYPRGVGYWVKG